MVRARLPVVEPLDLRATLAPLRRGTGDPTIRLLAGHAWLAHRTVEGPATVHLHHTGDVLEVEAWGPGAEAAVAAVPALVGDTDDRRGFVAHHRLVARLHHDAPGLRLPRTGRLFDALVPTIIEQRVTGFEAKRTYRQLVARWGEPAPGPAGLWLAPTPEALADVAYYDLHVLGVERKRADTLRRVAAHARRLEPLVDLPPAEARARMEVLPGVGRWTSAEAALVALGDPDAVSVGDWHLKHQVAFALAGEAEGTDERMLELLEPYAGHRGRVCRLIVAAGIGPPRRAPRYAPQPIAGR
jgi:3-methyladenine DNA glycosylase/8-oxoguanine DNA glycosylase